MRREALDQAIDGLAMGAADSPLGGLLKLAAQVADCPFAALMVAYPGRDQVVAGWGLPSFLYRNPFPNTPEDVELRKHYRQFHDTQDVPELESSMLVSEMGVRFMVIVPLPIDRLDVGIHILCCDFREHIPPAPDLQKRLENIALICAGVLRQSGEIVGQAERLGKVRNQLDNFVDAIVSTDRTAAFLDGQFRVVRSTSVFEGDMGMAFGRQNKVPLSELFPDDAENIEEQLAILLAEDDPIRLVSVRYRPDNTRRTLIVTRIIGADIDQPKYCVEIRKRRDRNPFIAPSLSPNVDYDTDVSNYMKENPATLSNFLFTTLIENRKVHHRKGIAFHSIRRWKAPVKDAQIEALKALKKDPSGELISRAAGEIAQEAETLFGADAFGAVSAVPCGHSGPDCFACKLAKAVGAIMNKPYYAAFETLPVKGSSHPKTNARRPKMVLCANDGLPTLLIDDVATSGAHLAEATKALRESGVTVFPLTWIAA